MSETNSTFKKKGGGGGGDATCTKDFFWKLKKKVEIAIFRP